MKLIKDNNPHHKLCDVSYAILRSKVISKIADRIAEDVSSYVHSEIRFNGANPIAIEVEKLLNN